MLRQNCLLFSYAFLLAATAWAGELRCLRPGAPVISLYRDNRYFPGRVNGLGDNIDVTFQNGLQQTYSSFTNEVIVDDIPEPSELSGGSRVLAKRPSSISFEPGFVNGSIEGFPLNDTFLVNFDSGDSIVRNINDIRLAVKPRSCMNEKGIYIGCFENVVNNFLTNYYPINPTDVATCNWACFTRGFHFAGLQNGTWCFCGNHVNDSLKVDDKDCNIACRDSREDVCGGFQRMTVYWTGADVSDNSTNDLSESPSDDTRSLNSEPDLFKTELSAIRGECADLHDSEQCNSWADQSKCVENPDWMLENCKKSCYACGSNEHKADKNDEPDAHIPRSDTSTQTQSLYQPVPQAVDQNQAFSSYARNSYPLTQYASTQSWSKNSDQSQSMSNAAGYLGCFRDSAAAHDLEYLADIRPLSIRACVTKCKSMRFPYAGVQSSTSCYCGLHYGRYGQLEHEECNTPCEAVSTEMCGGVSKNSLYQTGFPIKFKFASTSQKPSTQSNVPTNPAYQQHPNNYDVQYEQPTYLQPETTYSPTFYSQSASPYDRVAIPGYSQTADAQSYQPVYNDYYNQASSLQPPGTANAATRDFSPEDSSSYRWRETYVEQRQQEQEKYSKPNTKNVRKMRTEENKWLENAQVPGNFVSRNYEKNDKFLPQHKNLGNNPKPSKIGETKYQESSNNHPSKSKKSPEKSLYKNLISKANKNSYRSISHGKKILQKGGDNSRKPSKHSGTRGVFLRKKASKKSSFLAFLPHEVTEDETLLSNVYSMLSIMLKNLRKHKKSSMRSLKKYLKFSAGEHISKLTRRAPASEGEESPGLPERPGKRKVKVNIRHKHHKLDAKLQRHRSGSEIHPFEGQKQLSKPGGKLLSGKTKKETFAQNQSSNVQWSNAKMMYEARDSSHATNHSLATNGQPTASHENVSEEDLHRGDMPFLKKFVQKDQSLVSGSRLDSQWNSSILNRKVPVKSEKNGKNANRNASNNAIILQEKLMKRHENITERNEKSKFVRNGKSLQDYKEHESSFEEEFAKNKTGLGSRSENLMNAVSTKSIYTEGSQLDKLPESKLEEKGVLRDNETSKNQADETNMVERSDADIISTIIDLLEKEKTLKNTQDDKNMVSEAKQRKLQRRGEKRKNRSVNSRNSKEREEENKVWYYRKERRGKRNRKKPSKKYKHKNAMKKRKRLYKKDRLGRVSNDDNLMKEDEDYKETNRMIEHAI